MKKIILTASLLTLAFVFLTNNKALAYRGNPAVQGPNCSNEKYQAVQKAIANKDFNSWKKLMADRGAAKVIDNQKEFEKFLQMRKLMLEKKYDEAAKIRAELGLGMGGGFGRGYNRK